jgi:hypothetical protein
MTAPENILQDLETKRSLETRMPVGAVEIRARRNDLLNWLYQSQIVEASMLSAHLADKLFFANAIKTYAAQAYLKFHPRSEGLQRYLEKESFKADIQKDFPKGFIVKPVGSMNSDGNNLLVDESFFTAVKNNPEGFFLKTKERCGLTGLFSSNERFLIQEKVGTKAEEYRLHTLEERVVLGATYTRWNQKWDHSNFVAAEKALQDFLQELPPFLTSRQAWSVDLMGSKDLGFKIIEINTNRGKQGHWSGDLEIPDTLAAYAKHLELHYGAKFMGEEGRKLLQGEANQEKYLEKFGAGEVARHQELRLELRQQLLR